MFSFCRPAITLSVSGYTTPIPKQISHFDDRLVGLVVKTSASRPGAVDPEFDFRLRRGDFFPDGLIPMTSKLAPQYLPFQAPGVIGSALGLVGPLSVYCDRVR